MDEEWHGKASKPPLFGIPFSIKANFFMRGYDRIGADNVPLGYDCTIGLAKWLEIPKEEDCSFVTYLKNLGAVGNPRK